MDSSNSISMICAYPISGQYALLQRILLYLLFVTAFFARKVLSLANLLFGAALACTCTAALHAMVLAATYNNSAIDLDVGITFHLCALCLYFSLPILQWSKAIHASRASVVVIAVWIVWTFIGAVCARVSITRTYNAPSECQALTLDMFDSTACQAACQALSSPIRATQSASYIDPSNAFRVSFFTVDREKSPDWYFLCGVLLLPWTLMFAHMGTDDPAENTSLLGTLPRRVRRRVAGVRWSCTSLLFPPLGVALFVGQIVVMELNVVQFWVLPVEDPMYVVGQWSTWAALGLALAGFGIFIKAAVITGEQLT